MSSLLKQPLTVWIVSIRCSLQGKGENQKAQAYVSRRQWCGTWCTMFCHNISGCARDTREGWRQPTIRTSARLGPRPARSEANDSAGGAVSSPVVRVPRRTKVEESASCNRVRKFDSNSSGKSLLRHGVSERKTFTMIDDPSTDDLTVFTQEISESPAAIGTSSEIRRTLRTGPTESRLLDTSIDGHSRPEQYVLVAKNFVPTEKCSTDHRRTLVTHLRGTNSRALSGRPILATGPSVTRREGMSSSPSVYEFSRLPRSPIDRKQEGLDSVRPNNSEADDVRKQERDPRQARDPPQTQWRNRNNPSAQNVPSRQNTEIGALAAESSSLSFEPSRDTENGVGDGELPPPELPPLGAVVPHGQARGLTQLRRASALDSESSDAVVSENVGGVGACSPRDTSRSQPGNSDRDGRIVSNSGNDTHAIERLGEPEIIALILGDPLRRRSMTNPASEMALPVEGAPLDTSGDGMNNNGECTQTYNNVSGPIGSAVHGSSTSSSTEERGGGCGLNVSPSPVTTTTAAQNRYANYTFAATPLDGSSVGTNRRQHFGW